MEDPNFGFFWFGGGGGVGFVNLIQMIQIQKSLMKFCKTSLGQLSQQLFEKTMQKPQNKLSLTKFLRFLNFTLLLDAILKL